MGGEVKEGEPVGGRSREAVGGEEVVSSGSPRGGAVSNQAPERRACAQRVVC